MDPDDKAPAVAVEKHLGEGNGDRLITGLNTAIRQAIRVLAVLMVIVIFLSVADVAFVLYEKLWEPPLLLLNLNDIFVVFASFLAVLIAIEIFANITLYLRDDVILVRLVIATALMAIARKVIVLDFNTVQPEYLYGTGAVLLALGVTYWLVASKART
ncbi:MAG TPA: phosphate-starvation-inducible PsiE family protein [Hydrogenophaga sp.]|uniref:phosphate-starvation-inducible PsiE family protein n=1 Tax=Hydrogenophaga sp. TaxID=1904254 RepID=UPI002C86CEB3|nr:phosphate-starvation-inducible PsiE family protein [Hydrogenophaga sp.]HMN93823.1 phosphate-starvation-inducible PsiE family protein [Hydrogenophaga sp.]HMP09654.1 phosphate-starvation-inducible PsiE family protein [Hydrogenophaga sp.]